MGPGRLRVIQWKPKHWGHFSAAKDPPDVKTNLGHLESAAGTASLIKVLLMMKHSKIAPSLFFDRPNPNIDFHYLNLTVPTQLVDWTNQNKVACVNCFGFGGTNSHAVVKAFKDPSMRVSRLNEEVENTPCIVCFSAKNEKSLRGSIEDFVQHPEVNSFDVHDVSFTSTARRDHYPVRHACIVEDMAELLAKLNAVIQSGDKEVSVSEKVRPVFVFCGMGTSWKGMCRELVEESSVFRDTISQIDQCLSEYVKWSLMTRLKEESHISDPEFSPIAIFACQVALGQLWSSLGIRPACVVGQSIGEIAAAFFAGILSLRDAVKITFFRTSSMSKVVGGKMFIVRNMQVQKVKDVLEKFTARANVSLEYSPVSCAVSGDADVITDIKQEILNKGRSVGVQVQIKDLQVPVAYHSHHVDSCKDDLGKALSSLVSDPPSSDVQMISSVTGQCVTGPLDAEYWVNNMREPVRFFEAIQKTVVRGVKNVYLEVGPKPVLRAHAGDVFPTEVVVPISSMYKQPEWKIFLQAVVSLYEQGLDIKWSHLPSRGRSVTCVPRYCFNPRRTLQINETAHMVLAGVVYMRKEHPFVFTVDTTKDIKTIISELTFLSVYDHVVSGRLIIPGALYAEIGFAVAMLHEEMTAPLYSVSVRFELPCSFTRDTPLELDVTVNPAPAKGFGVDKFQSYKLSVVQGSKTFANIHLQAHQSYQSASDVNLRHIEARCNQQMNKKDIYEALKSFGFQYGPNYSLLTSSRKGQHECLTKIQVPKTMFEELHGTKIHPSILDGMLQTPVILMNKGAEDLKLLPKSIGKLTCYRRMEDDMIIHTVLKRSEKSETWYDIKLTTLCGEVIADLEDLSIKSLTDKSDALKNMYRCFWKPLKTNYTTGGKEEKENVLFVTDSVPEDTPTSLVERCVLIDPLKQSPESVVKPLEAKIKDKGEQLEQILILLNSQICETDEACDVQSKVLKFCLLLKTMYQFAYEKSLTARMFLFTNRAFPLEGDKTEPENVNPIMTALWGMTRSVLKEQIYTNFASVDLHLPGDRLSLSHAADLADMLSQEESLCGYPEYMVTETTIYVNQFDVLPPDTTFPGFRHNFADSSQDLIFLSQEPEVLTDSFAVHRKAQTQDVKNSYMRIDVTATALQNPLLYNMKIPYNKMEKSESQIGNGYPLFALENMGTEIGYVNGKKQKGRQVSCYPVPAGNNVTVPSATTMPADLIPDYAPGDLSRFVLLWSLHELVVTKKATILVSLATAKQGKVLLQLLESKKKSKSAGTNLVFLEDLGKIESVGETLVSLVLLEDTVVSALARRWPLVTHFITVSILLQDSARSAMALLFPNTRIHLLDTSLVFQPQNLISIVPTIEKWMKKHKYLMSSVSSCLHKIPNTSGVFSPAVADLDELLDMQVLQIKSPMVRTDKSDLFRNDAIYIVVGGLTGLGWLFVQFLSRHGAGNIAILNRREPTADRQKEMEKLMASESCSIKAFQGDVVNLESLKTFFRNMYNSFHGAVLKGLFFGAAVVDDKLLLDTDVQSFAKVLTPKVMGTWNLHQLTKDLPLDYFVLHSSLTSALGNAGQASYGAGNAFMDGMAYYRKHRNLSGQTINWGPIDLGLLDDNSKARKFLEKQGFDFMTEDDVTAVIIPSLLLDLVQIIPCIFHKDAFLNRGQRYMVLPLRYRVKPLIGSWTQDVDIEEDILLTLKTARDLPSDQRVDMYERYVKALAGIALNVKESTIKSDSNLTDIGIDSIVAMTMINEIYKELHCKLEPIVFLTGDLTVRDIAQAIDDVLSEKGT